MGRIVDFGPRLPLWRTEFWESIFGASRSGEDPPFTFRSVLDSVGRSCPCPLLCLDFEGSSKLRIMSYSMTISKRTSNVNKSKSDTNNMLDVLVEKNQNCLYKTMEEVVPFGAKFHLYLA